MTINKYKSFRDRFYLFFCAKVRFSTASSDAASKKKVFNSLTHLKMGTFRRCHCDHSRLEALSLAWRKENLMRQSALVRNCKQIAASEWCQAGAREIKDLWSGNMETTFHLKRSCPCVTLIWDKPELCNGEHHVLQEHSEECISLQLRYG